MMLESVCNHMRFRTNHANNNANSIQTDRQTDRSDTFYMMLESNALIINTTAFAITCASGQTTLIIMQTAIQIRTDRQTDRSDTFSMMLESDALIINTTAFAIYYETWYCSQKKLEKKLHDSTDNIFHSKLKLRTGQNFSIYLQHLLIIVAVMQVAQTCSIVDCCLHLPVVCSFRSSARRWCVTCVAVCYIAL